MSQVQRKINARLPKMVNRHVEMINRHLKMINPQPEYKIVKCQSRTAKWGFAGCYP